MRTVLETKTNIDSWLNNWKSVVESSKDWFNKSLLTVIENREVSRVKWSERLAISRNTKKELIPLIENTHSLVEIELAKMFWLDWIKVAKLQEDFKEPMTLSWVLSDAEWYWYRHDIVNA